MRGWSPETTSRVLAAPTLSRAARRESPVPSGRSWTATSTPSSASAASGESTTTSGSAPSGRTASTTQSTRRRPSRGCRCFGVEDFIRVPRPAAMTTAARSFVAIRAGAPGFEPGIAGPKPAALPLGYAPSTVSLPSVAAEVPTLPDGGRAGKADTALTVGAASGASALGYAPSNRCLYKVLQPNADAAGRRPRGQSRHGLDGRRRKRHLSTWLRPTGRELKRAWNPRRDTQGRPARRLRPRRSPRARGRTRG